MREQEEKSVGTMIESIVKALNLKPLEGEGGMYRLRYGGREESGAMKAYSSIYYLLTEHSFSHMHRLAADEIYHYYMGDSLEILLLHPDGRWECRLLGTGLLKGEEPQILVPAGVWQGARVVKGGGYCLAGTTMAPAYRDEDYVHGDCEILCRDYPGAEEKIRERCGKAMAL